MTANFAYGLADSAKPNALNKRGVPTTLTLSPRKPTVVNYIMAVAEIPAEILVKTARLSAVFDKSPSTWPGYKSGIALAL